MQLLGKLSVVKVCCLAFWKRMMLPAANSGITYLLYEAFKIEAFSRDL